LARATWGGDTSQGAFGLLDGGRGLLAAVIGLIMVTFFAALLPADSETATHSGPKHCGRVFCCCRSEIILCAFVGFKAIDDVSLSAHVLT